jgi:hypothetical protein
LIEYFLLASEPAASPLFLPGQQRAPYSLILNYYQINNTKISIPPKYPLKYQYQ